MCSDRHCRQALCPSIELSTAGPPQGFGVGRCPDVPPVGSCAEYPHGGSQSPRFASIRRLLRGAGGPDAPPAPRTPFTGRAGRRSVRRSRAQPTKRAGVYLPQPFTENICPCVTAALAPLPPRREGSKRAVVEGCYLVDPASSHMLVSKIKPCKSKYKLLYSETANSSLKQL